MGWKNDARRLVTGEKKELASFEGYWIRPRKYSVAAKDSIAAIQRKLQKGVDKKALSSVVKKVKGKDVSEDDILECITDDELAALLDSQNIEAKELIKTKLSYGIAEHNFEGSSVEQLAEEILEYEDIALEMLSVVEDFNRPLAQRTSSTFKTSRNGSTEEPALSTVTSTQTDESQLS